MSTRTSAIEIACAAFHRALVGDAKLPSQHAINHRGIGFLDELMSAAISHERNRVKYLQAELPEEYEREKHRAKEKIYAMQCAMRFLKAQHNAVPVISRQEEQAIEEASAAI